MGEAKKNTGTIIINVFAGLGMGLLVGIIVGLSVSPVVSVILGALASLLAAFLGLQPGRAAAEEKTGTSLSNLQQNSLKAGSFGLACMLAILLGLFIRNYNVFGQPVDKQFKEWKKAGYTDTYARQLIVLEKFGIDPETKAIIYGDLQKSKTTGLFANEGQTDPCSALDPERYNEISERLNALRRLDQPQFTRLADLLEQLDVPESDKQSLLTALWEVLCD